MNKDEIDIGVADIEKYICDEEKTKMFFLTNPFDNALIAPSAPQNEVKFMMKCEAFLWNDLSLDDDQQAQWVVHYYLDQESEKIDSVDASQEDVKNQLYINGTELNQ